MKVISGSVSKPFIFEGLLVKLSILIILFFKTCINAWKLYMYMKVIVQIKMNWSYESVRNINESGILYQFPVYFNHNFPFLTKPRKSLIIKGVYFAWSPWLLRTHHPKRMEGGGGRQCLSLHPPIKKNSPSFSINKHGMQPGIYKNFIICFDSFTYPALS